MDSFPLKRTVVAFFLWFATTSSVHAFVLSGLYASFEAEAQQYRSLMAMHPELLQSKDELRPMIQMGERLYQWIEVINQAREESLSLSSPESQPATHISQPKFNNRRLLKARFAKFKTEAPVWLTRVVLDGEEMSAELPVAEAAFLDWGRKTDALYRAASRWLLQEPNLFSYSMRQREDVRGYYHLSRMEDVEATLARWAELDPAQIQQLTPWLLGMCRNSRSMSACQSAFEQSVAQSSVLSFYKRYLPTSQRTWFRYFDIRNARSDVEWDSTNPNLLRVPFLKPKDPAIQDFLRNIEDEFQWQDWQLELNFVSSSFNTPNIRFSPGVTPHVNCLGCNNITMDANVPLTDYAVNWTIRHEFGHVLGLPDCYVEFYDSKEEHMVYYQLDTENLMCSRRGKFMQLHFDELQEHYYRD